MFNCKNCGAENEQESSFCGNCGNLLQKENENNIIYSLKMIGKGILNPAAYIRNAKNLSIINSGIFFGIFSIVALIQSFLLVTAISSYAPIKVVFKLWILNVIGQALIIIVQSAICYGILKTLKEENEILSIANIFLSVSTIFSILMIVPTLAIFISLTIAVFFLLIVSAFYYVIMYIGLKDSIKINSKKVFMIVMLCYIGSLIINRIVISMIM